MPNDCELNYFNRSCDDYQMSEYMQWSTMAIVIGVVVIVIVGILSIINEHREHWPETVVVEEDILEMAELDNEIFDFVDDLYLTRDRGETVEEESESDENRIAQWLARRLHTADSG